jgi:hypothetical protein
MGTCKYCGQNAGLLKSKHNDCETKHQTGLVKLNDKISDTIQKGGDFNFLDKEIDFIKKDSFVTDNERLSCFVKAFDQTIDKYLDDGILTKEEEDLTSRLLDYYHFEQSFLNKNGSYEKLIKASVLRDLNEGKTPSSRIKIEETLPFLLQKSEILIWIFQNVGFYEQKIKTIYEGRSAGVSFRIAKGVYYRTGAFRGNPVQVSEMRPIGTGLFAISNKNIYFSSTSKSIKIPINKILTLNQFEDGIGIQKDGASAKPQIFKNLDGWFAYNLISILNQSQT